ncbi:hypothetical protein TNCV_4449071 [Trichonephila clavipes]|nr:hypothetical protein TNCV_4449071 [Trichonephila clavipes]
MDFPQSGSSDGTSRIGSISAEEVFDLLFPGLVVMLDEALEDVHVLGRFGHLRTINVNFVYYRIPKQRRLVSFRSAGLNNFLAEAY